MRLLRRKGWEEAYVDYESLKLLLTQIEAVYEESSQYHLHNNTVIRSNDHHLIYDDGAGIDDDENDDQDFEFYNHRQNNDEENNIFFVSPKRIKKKKKKKKGSDNGGHNNNDESGSEKNDFRNILFVESDSSFAYGSLSEEASDYVDLHDHGKNDVHDDYTERSYEYDNGLMRQHNSPNPDIFNFSYSAPSYGSADTSNNSIQGEYNEVNDNHESIPILSSRRRRRHAQTETRKRRKHHRHSQNVPHHIRVTHAKARLITARFLGLLKAEVDKLCLFVHARFGELTDTCGSLRFPFDQFDVGHNDNDHIGILPSASSSSDDGTTNYLSDSSQDPFFLQRRNNTNNHNSNDGNWSMKEELMSDEEDTNVRSTWRQIKIAEELRIAKPTPFQRSDFVLGEDFLLLSAVDEADAYTSVGVEFLHLLKFICVNSIVVRRLCRKHDRLLASRMLGGYYHRQQHNDSPKPNQNTLTGVYDSIVLGLANNSAANHLSQSLYLALSEYEVSRRRANALSSLREKDNKKSLIENVANVGNDATCFHFPSPSFVRSQNLLEANIEKDIISDDGAQSTYSDISLTRLRFAVISITRLRDATQKKSRPFRDFLCRSMCVTSNNQIVGTPQGLHGCSREALSNMTKYNPDLILLRETQILNDCFPKQFDRNIFSNIHNIGTYDSDLFSLFNLFSLSFITMNYYIIVPSAISFCEKIGSSGSYSTLLIFAPSISNFVLSSLRLGSDTREMTKTESYNYFVLSGLFHLLGNIMYTVSFCRKSFWLGVISRLVIGLFSSDRHHRQIATSIMGKNSLRTSIANLRKTQLLSVCTGLLVGSMLQLEEINFNILQHMFVLSSETITGYVMFCIWTVKLVILIKASPILMSSSDKAEMKGIDKNNISPSVSDESQSQNTRSDSRHSRGASDQSKLDSYLKKLQRKLSEVSHNESTRRIEILQSTKPTQKYIQTLSNDLNKTFKLILSNPALHISMLLHTFSNMVIELIIMSCIIITHRDFNWSGSLSGRFLALLLLMYIPVYFVTSAMSVWYIEKGVMKRGLHIIIISLIASFNYQSVYESVIDIYNEVLYLFRGDKGDDTRSNAFLIYDYDWGIGLYQYVIGTIILFASSVSIEGASLSLISKASTDKLNVSNINCTSLIPLQHCLGQIFAGLLLMVVMFSHHHIHTDVMNLISIFLLVASVFCLLNIKKYYFFLYGA